MFSKVRATLTINQRFLKVSELLWQKFFKFAMICILTAYRNWCQAVFMIQAP